MHLVGPSIQNSMLDKTGGMASEQHVPLQLSQRPQPSQGPSMRNGMPGKMDGMGSEKHGDFSFPSPDGMFDKKGFGDDEAFSKGNMFDHSSARTPSMGGAIADGSKQWC